MSCLSFQRQAQQPCTDSILASSVSLFLSRKMVFLMEVTALRHTGHALSVLHHLWRHTKQNTWPCPCMGMITQKKTGGGGGETRLTIKRTVLVSAKIAKNKSKRKCTSP